MKGAGIYAYAHNISTEKRTADIGVDAEVRNDDVVARSVSCHSIVVDGTGTAVDDIDAGTQTLLPGAQSVFSATKTVADLHFWQPGYPYLYRIHTILTQGGTPVDDRETVTGFRKIEIRGSVLYINNRLLMTMGYAPRSTNEWPVLGAAYPDWLHQYSDQLMVNGNADMVRWMHVMPSPQDTAACDRIGLMQMFPAADREGDMYGREWEIRSHIMRDSIIYNRNSPSIILWENGNGDIDKSHRDELDTWRQQWDPHGMRPMGGRGKSPELLSWMFGVHKEEHRLSIDCEYMRDESPRRWWDQWSPPYLHSTGEVSVADGAGGWNWNQDNMCVQQAKEYDRYYQARPGTSALCCNGGMKIIFADSESHSRGIDTFRRSGPVDGMRVAKDAYFCNQAIWSNTPELWTGGRPMVFLPGHWNYPAGTIKPIYVFTSPGIDHVALLVNGTAVGIGTRVNPFVTTFDHVAFAPGEIIATGYDETGKALASSSHVTAGPPATLRLMAIQGPGGVRADGQDVALLETEVLDAAGHRCPNAVDVVAYAVTGPARWLGGIWEEDVARYIGKSELPVICGVHRVAVRSTFAAGTISITASSSGLTSATIEIASHAIRLVDGLSPDLPTIDYPVLPRSATYGPDLAPAPRPPADFFDDHDYRVNPVTRKESDENHALGRLHVAFVGKAGIATGARDGVRIYADEPWTFAELPAYLQGADYIYVANRNATTAAAEGFVFTLLKSAVVYLAYDDINPTLPVNNSGTVFTPTGDSLIIHGHHHCIYRTEPLKALTQLYLGTNNWPGTPPVGANNCVVLVQPIDTGSPGQQTPKPKK